MKKLINKVSEKSVAMKDAVVDSMSLEKISEKLSGISNSAKEKITNSTNQLISLVPIIEEMGYKTTGISISIGLPPDVNFHFQKIKNVSLERRNEILEEHKDKIMLNSIVKMLTTTDEYRDKLKLGSFKFRSIDIRIGLNPAMSMQLSPE